MRSIRIRLIMLYLIILIFFLGLGFFSYELIVKGEKWVFSPVNRHLSQGRVSQGEILDRFGEVLACTCNGKRTYHEDVNIRKALVHTVGDGSVLIPTSVQSRYAKELFGYNLIAGLGFPEIINMNKSITLSLDSKLCSKVSSSFKDKKGTALAYNYLNGEIICMISLPNYDPENKPSFKTQTDDKLEGIYLNRALSSSYTPGSVFKLFTCAAALDLIEGVEDKKFFCGKIKIVNGEKVSCMKKHGNINLKDALSKSCDIVFCDIALELGKEKMTQKMEEMGFNNSISFENSKLSQSEYCLEGASQGDIGWSGIGQYKNTLNPMHMLRFMGAIANNGVCTEPHAVKSVNLEGNGGIGEKFEIKTTSILRPSTAQKIREMMRYTVKNQYGDKMFSPAIMCAKTGTAEVGEGKLPHGWMVGFSYDTSFPVAFAVVVENGDFGIKSAGPIASNMIKHLYYSFKNGNYF